MINYPTTAPASIVEKWAGEPAPRLYDFEKYEPYAPSHLKVMIWNLIPGVILIGGGLAIWWVL